MKSDREDWGMTKENNVSKTYEAMQFGGDGIEADDRVIDDRMARKHLEAGFEKAEGLLGDKDKLEELLLQLERKLRDFPVFGETLSDVPMLIMMIRDYANKKYDRAPMGSIVAAISAVAYVALGFDLIPDFVPVAGVLDDVAIVAVCMNYIGSDVDDYRAWRAACGK